MKITFLLLVIMVGSSLLGACSLVTGETLNTPAETLGVETQNVSVEMVLENTLIKVDSQFTDITPRATEFKVLFITKGKIKQPVNTYEGKLLKPGDPCMIITAEFMNNTNYTPLALISVNGLDADGTQKSWALDVGPLVGVANYDIPAQTTTRINITANWVDDLAIIRLNVHIQKQFYDLTFTPATPVPESEMARIWFDEEWFVKNDMEPSPIQVRITFPARWLEIGKSDSFTGTGIELAVPRQMLLNDNESTNPDEITVLFPIDYFNGRPDAPATSVAPK